MAGRDRREDPGQYYPGGSVIPKTPTGQGGGGTSDYDNLANKPKINNHELIGNRTAAQLGLADLSDIPDVLGKLPLRSLPKYLHYLAFDDTYPADAESFYDSVGGARVMGGCSIVRKGGLVGGNFDYPYDDACSFAIKVSAAKGANADGSDRHASVGAAYLGTRLTENIVSSGVSTPLYRVLPGMTESGINDSGVYAKINVIPRDPTKDPVQSSTRNLHALAVVRYVLDHFDNAADAAEYIAAHYYIPEGSADSYHWMIADKDGQYVVEDGDIDHEYKVLTNYRVISVSDPYGCGLRRYEYLADAEGTVSELLEAVKFTNAYAANWPWPDEFAGQEDAQGKIPYTATERLKAWANEHVAPLLDANRKPAARGNGCWQTVHSCIYDFERKTMAICVQEDFSKRYVFAVDQANVDLTPIEAQIAALQSGKRDKTDLREYREWKIIRQDGYVADYYDDPRYSSISICWYCSFYIGGKFIEELSCFGGGYETELTFHSSTGDTIVMVKEMTSIGDLPTIKDLGGKVDKIPGKGLSSNDYTDADKAEVAKVKDKADELTEWEFSGEVESGHSYAVEESPIDETYCEFILKKDGDWFDSLDGQRRDSLTVNFNDIAHITATRRRVLRTGDAATPQEVAQVAEDVTNKRDITDNTCHKTEFGQWTLTGSDAPSGAYDVFFRDAHLVVAVSGEDYAISRDTVDEVAVLVDDFREPSGPRWKTITATRSAVCTDGKKFVTDDVAAKKADIFGNDGKPSDTFATDLLGKQVAISAIHDNGGVQHDTNGYFVNIEE